MHAARDLADTVGVLAACKGLGVAPATYYRHRRAQDGGTQAPRPRPTPARALTGPERTEALDVLHEPRFVDKAPVEVYATLLDEDRYLCSVRTFYRLLAAHDEVRERRDQLRHPAYKKPELLATGPNEVWSWDVTKLLGPAKWNYFYLFVILDIFSRYVVGWMIAERETAKLARRLIRETCAKQDVDTARLTIHADRGPAQKSKSLALLLADLGITKSHSRPYTSNDNPYSEAQFKTLKYRPEFPGRFGCVQDARAFGRVFFPWYNDEHHHAGIGLLTPADVHYGRAQQVYQARQKVLLAAHLAHPERFVHGQPRPPALPQAAWINRPETPTGSKEALQ